MFIGEAYKKQVENVYFELKKKGEVSGYLDQERLGGIKVFINEKPKSILSSFIVDGDTIYVGSDEI